MTVVDSYNPGYNHFNFLPFFSTINFLKNSFNSHSDYRCKSSHYDIKNKLKKRSGINNAVWFLRIQFLLFSVFRKSFSAFWNLEGSSTHRNCNKKLSEFWIIFIKPEYTIKKEENNKPLFYKL
jgi:hypothetical protein